MKSEHTVGYMSSGENNFASLGWNNVSFPESDTVLAVLLQDLATFQMLSVPFF